MRMRSKGRAALLLRRVPVTAVGLMALGGTLLALGLPADWIDLAALTLAAVSARPTRHHRPAPAPRTLRRRNLLARRRTDGDTR
ncbi:hypothetical protein OG875_01810 [Streptomyces sp. NBC_01498]|uniref:hypothetical protein n=1 Tax=Streptomyces sp. NBC_01498 TaxID=2975870 RepID=UPI002E7B7A8E|nr:hypothetical protein [Streptomyces sp. NBC_01498]WTL23447.1 hypothetical protein OG875_01810 [Streptomyces sp. NBC_01498]